MPIFPAALKPHKCNFSEEYKNPSVKCSDSVTLKSIGLGCTLNESLPVHNFVASCIVGHLKNISLQSLLIANVDTFYFIISKNHKSEVSSEKSLNIRKLPTLTVADKAMFSEIYFFFVTINF